jgi:CheY-like chemotaxis protein/two-component sensor histidine kinase
VRGGVERIASITRDLRTFSRPDDSRREPLALVDVVRGVMRLVGKAAEARAAVELVLGETPWILANEARLAQVALNLITNALDAVGPRAGGRVTVETRAEAGAAILEVRDNGPGIPADLGDRIFDPFVTTKPVGEGTGLGLFVCRNLVHELGGRISAHPAPGGGALLRVVLPAARRPGLSDAPPAATAAGAPSARVVVIDDERAVGEALVRTLRQAGFDAEAIVDGRAGLDRLVGGAPFDLALCDLMMPGLTGMDVADALGREAPERLERVVFMTGGAFTPRAARFLEGQGERCLMKPFDVVAEVRRRLER